MNLLLFVFFFILKLTFYILTFPAIVIAAYNRPHCLKRLLVSVAKGIYPNRAITLVISIDKSDNEKVMALATDFEWAFGEKKIFQHKVHLGLKAHILSCGDLSEKYAAIILLEDDLMVSPYFYQYALAALSFFKNDAQIAGISLYHYQIAESCFYPFLPIEDGADNYFIQIAASWGQAWTAQQWQGFRQWYARNPLIQPTDKLPTYIHKWTDYSWKKRFVKYLLATNKYFIFPRTALSTNFGDQGTSPAATGLFQVPLQRVEKRYHFKKLADSHAVYDIYFEIMPHALKKLAPHLTTSDFEVDLYDTKDPAFLKKQYVLTTRPAQKAIQTFAWQMLPNVANIIKNIEGSGINLLKTSDLTNKKRPDYQYYYQWNALADTIFTSLLDKHPFFLERIAIHAKDVIAQAAWERAYPKITILTPIFSNGNGLSKTVQSVLQQPYPNVEYLLIGQDLFLKKLVFSNPKKHTIRRIAIDAKTDFWQAIKIGMEQAEGELFGWLPQGATYFPEVFSLIADLFNRFVEVHWIVGGQVNKDSSLKLSAAQCRALRWTKEQFYSNNYKQIANALLPQCVFFDRLIWEQSGSTIHSSLKEITGFELFARFWQHTKLYGAAIPLSLQNDTSKSILPSISASASPQLQHLKIRYHKPESFFKKSVKALFYPLYRYEIPYFRHFYIEMNNIHPIIRYDENNDAFYFSKY